MTDLNEKMEEALTEDNFNTIENIALNPNHALVRTTQYNMFTDEVSFVNKWVDISNVGDDYWEDLSSDCQDYVMSLDKYKNMDYDTMIDDYNKPIEKIHDDALKYFKDQIKKREVA